MTRRTLALVSAAVLVCSVSTFAQTASSQSGLSEQAAVAGGASASTGRALPNVALMALRRPVASVEWLDTPFEEVVEWLKDEAGGQVNVFPRWNALSVEGVDADTMVTLQLSNSTVAQVLNEVMDALSPEGQLAYRAKGNMLKLSTKADFDRKLYLRVYDATDILFTIDDFGDTAPVIDLQQAGQSGGGGGGGSQGVFSGSSSQEQGTAGEQIEQEMLARLGEVRTIIEEMIAPETWDTAQTGGVGRVRVYGRSLIVLNTIEVHEMIAGYFVLGM